MCYVKMIKDITPFPSSHPSFLLKLAMHYNENKIHGKGDFQLITESIVYSLDWLGKSVKWKEIFSL